jgi:hypothetical protein
MSPKLKLTRHLGGFAYAIQTWPISIDGQLDFGAQPFAAARRAGEELPHPLLACTDPAHSRATENTRRSFRPWTRRRRCGGCGGCKGSGPPAARGTREPVSR